jgi:hypothetical protein
MELVLLRKRVLRRRTSPAQLRGDPRILDRTRAHLTRIYIRLASSVRGISLLQASARETVIGVVADRCASEGCREPGVADMVPAVLMVMGVDRPS